MMIYISIGTAMVDVRAGIEDKVSVKITKEAGR